MTVSKKIAFEAFTRIVNRSPVDTGLFRNSWTFGEGSQTTIVRRTPDRNGSDSMAEAYKVLSVQLPGVWLFQNSLPYAMRIEYGWSQQSPQGVVRLTAMEIDSHIQKALGR